MRAAVCQALLAEVDWRVESREAALGDPSSGPYGRSREWGRINASRAVFRADVRRELSRLYSQRAHLQRQLLIQPEPTQWGYRLPSHPRVHLLAGGEPQGRAILRANGHLRPVLLTRPQPAEWVVTP